MAGLKTIVITLGVLIVVVVGAIIWRATALLSSGSGVGFGDFSLALPQSCRILDAVPADGHILLRIGDGPACDRVILFDPSTGKLRGTLLP